MSVRYCTILAIVSAALAFTLAIRKEFSPDEACEYIQKHYLLIQPMYYGIKLDFKEQDRNLRGNGRILPSQDFTITDCEVRLENSDNKIMSMSATLKDKVLMVLFENRPWVELVDPVASIGMESETTNRNRKIKMSSFNINFSEALVNKTSLDETSIQSVKKTVNSALSRYVLAQSFTTNNDFTVSKRLVRDALEEVFKHYIYRLKK